MESLLDGQHGATTLLAGLIVVLCFHLLIAIGKFLFELARKKSEVADRQNQELAAALTRCTETMQRLDSRITAIERDLNEVLKFKIDFRKLFSAVKYIAGDKWPEAREAMKDHGLE